MLGSCISDLAAGDELTTEHVRARVLSTDPTPTARRIRTLDVCSEDENGVDVTDGSARVEVGARS